MGTQAVVTCLEAHDRFPTDGSTSTDVDMLRASTRLSPAANCLTKRRCVPHNTVARFRDAVMIPIGADAPPLLLRGVNRVQACDDEAAWPQYWVGSFIESRPGVLGVQVVGLCCKFETVDDVGTGLAHPDSRITIRLGMPCAPCMRTPSISAVADGPLINRRGAFPASRCPLQRRRRPRSKV